MTRVLVVGASGLLGHTLVRELGPIMETWALTRTPASSAHPLARWVETSRWVGGVDVMHASALEDAIAAAAPSVIVNCVGFVPQRTSDPAAMWAVNARFPHRLAEIAARHGARLVHFSTDCVFDGTRGGYRETDHPNAVDDYGAAKAAGEPVGEHCLVVRSSFVGFECAPGRSLLEWALSRRGTRVEGYAQARYSGLVAPSLARVVARVLATTPALTGTFHVASTPLTKYDLLRAMSDALDLRLTVVPVDEPVVDRTLDGRAFTARTGIVLPSWEEMMDDLVRSASEYAYRSDLARSWE
jgi:dTDP-4-dehydrorhamnose reductase